MDFTIAKETLVGFEGYLIGKERALGTVEKYLRDVTEFACWLGDGELTKEAVAGWREELCGRGLRPGTVNGKLSAVTALLTMLCREDCRVKNLKVQQEVFREEKKVLEQNDLKKLVETARRLGKERLALLLEAICATGIRVSEVPYITVDAALSGVARVENKGKCRTVLLPGKLCKKLQKYARKHKIREGAIFITRTGKPMSRKQIWAEMKALCAAAGVEPSKVFPHNLRHLFAVTFYRVSKDIVKLADVLGHSSINTTRIYLKTSGEEHRKLLDSLRLVS